uniref:Nuclear cap-binding protein subunit 1 n=1 Tax=Angiostrongylus cantonensis TaxID=6313 RepID=A0A0K0DHJ6_ANGCA
LNLIRTFLCRLDYEVDSKKRRGPSEYDEVEHRLHNLIVRVDENTGGSSLESNLESLCSLLEMFCSPNLLKFQFRWRGELRTSSKQCLLLAYIAFLCDLGNSRVLTLSSIVDFLEALLQSAFEENVPQVRTDWFTYVVLRVLPWIGLELSEKKKEELDNILEAASRYIEGRKKVHVKMLQVWSSSAHHEQEDSLECLLAQIRSLQSVGWKEKQIARHYVAFDAALQDALQHNLPSFSPPGHKPESSYPLPTVVFRLFDYADCPDDVSISYLLLMSQEQFNSAEELTAYSRGANVPIAYMILEVLFSQLFRLPYPPQHTGFYGPLLLDLCRVQSSTMPQVLAQAAELLYQRAATMQPLCLDRFVDWFSFHLSNFGFRWSWNDWKDCLTADRWDVRRIFVGEVIEKCRRLSYYAHLKDFLPKSFAPMIPPPPDVICKYDDGEISTLFKIGLMTIQLLLKFVTQMVNTTQRYSRYFFRCVDENRSQNIYAWYFLKMLQMLMKTTAKSFSHTFVALTRYSLTLKTVADSSDEMQEVLLQTLFHCWRNNHLRIIILVDKMLKMQILDCGVVISWIFSGSLRSETHKQWKWEVLNTALERLSRHIHKVAHDVQILQKRVKHQRIGADDEMDDMDVKTREQEELEQQKEKLENLKDFQKSLFLDVLHVRNDCYAIYSFDIIVRLCARCFTCVFRSLQYYSQNIFSIVKQKERIFALPIFLGSKDVSSKYFLWWVQFFDFVVCSI